ncbi:MAG: MnmC family methyltransferase [Planctomycetota bacterium]
MDDWTPVITADGSLTLASGQVGEACHSRAGAWTEALERYARPARLRQRARSAELTRVHLLDVGTGLGWNLAAALSELRGTGAFLDVLSLERDRSVIESTLSLVRENRLAPPVSAMEHAPVSWALARALADPQRAASVGVPLGARGRLRVLLGDARVTLAASDPARRFDAVFLDPFSPRADPDLWQCDFLSQVARRMAPGSLLTTYCAAFDVRVRLVALGLSVGRGGRVGTKAEGTLASPDRSLPPLSPRLVRRLVRAAAELARSGGRAGWEGGPKSPRAGVSGPSMT